jgi:hypothetical protein
MSWTSTQSSLQRQPARIAWFIEFLNFGFVLAILLYFLLPGSALLLIGWDYLGGGPEFEKIHLATYLLVGLFSVLFVLDARFRNAAVSMCLSNMSLTTFVVSVAATAAYAILARKVSIAPFVDTFAAAIIVMIGCLCLPRRYLRVLKFFLDAYFVASVAILFFEYYTKSNILYSDHFSYYGNYFRTRALFEGPLTAASLLGIYSLVTLVSTRISFSLVCIIRLSLFCGSFIAIVTTGGRTSLVAAAVIIGGFVFISALNQVRRGYLNKAGLLYLAIAIPVVIVGISGLLWLGLFDTIISRFQNDIGSAFSREIALDLLYNMSNTDLWFGLSAQDVLNLVSVQAEYGLIAIEVSWVNFILVCGLIFTIPLFITYVLLLFRFLPRYCGVRVYAPSLFLLMVTSASNGIWTKTTILTTSFALMISFLKKSDIRD